MSTRSYFFLFMLLLDLSSSFAQSPDRALIRAKIDEERRNMFSWDEEQVHQKAREFINRDSTYYVGYLIEGSFRYERANDKRGFELATKDLQKAFDLIERDFDAQLRVRTADLTEYYKVLPIQQEYCNVAYLLARCWQNVERADNAMSVYRRVQGKNMQNDYSVEAYNSMAWLCHRNRMYTGMKFSFLKNSPKENNDLAKRYLDSAAMKYRNDAELNLRFYDPRFLQNQLLGISWYKAILYTHEFELDSAQFYYDQLMSAGWYSSNNFANFCYSVGNFRMAEEYYIEAEDRENFREKHTREFYYMRGIIDIYKGKPEEADSLLQNVINQQGSTPGFGWHSIALARARYYEGLTAESQKRLTKAANFQELHIGTTWGPEQYTGCVALFNYLNKVRQEREYLFEHDEWWFWLNPVNWVIAVKYKMQENNLRLLLASLLVSSPERGDVIYPLFSSENLMSFDEVGELIEGFSNDFFIQYFKQQLETDKRPAVKKYFRFMIGKLTFNEGDEDEAIDYLTQVLDDPGLDLEFDKLLIARTHELLALAYDENGEDERSKQALNNFYETFPQLVPFSDNEMRFRLEVDGDVADAESIKIISDLKNCTIDWTNDEDAPLVKITINKEGEAHLISYSAGDNGLGGAVASGLFKVSKKERKEAGALLAYRLFGIKKENLGGVIVNIPKPKVEK
jgi:hypothetical protein